MEDNILFMLGKFSSDKTAIELCLFRAICLMQRLLVHVAANRYRIFSNFVLHIFELSNDTFTFIETIRKIFISSPCDEINIHFINRNSSSRCYKFIKCR